MRKKIVTGLIMLSVIGSTSAVLPQSTIRTSAATCKAQVLRLSGMELPSFYCETGNKEGVLDNQKCSKSLFHNWYGDGKFSNFVLTMQQETKFPFHCIIIKNDCTDKDDSNDLNQPTQLAAPKTFQVNSIDSSTIQLHYGNVTGADSYVIYRADQKDGTYKKIASTKYTSYKDQNLDALTTYYYKVRAYSKDGQYGAFTKIESATTKANISGGQTNDSNQSESNKPQQTPGSQNGGNQTGDKNENQNNTDKPQHGGEGQTDTNKPQNGWGSQNGTNKPQNGWGSQNGTNKPQNGWGSQNGTNKPQNGWGSQNGTNKPQNGWGSQNGTNKPQNGWGNQTGGNNSNQDQEDTDEPKDENNNSERPEVENKPEQNNSSYVNEVVRLINVERKKAGLSPVTTTSALHRVAQQRAKEIVTSFSHTRPNGTSCFTALKEYQVSYTTCGENIAYGQQSPEAVMKAWMNSSGHRANILNKSFGKVGIGCYEKNGVIYWTQMFTN